MGSNDRDPELVIAAVAVIGVMGMLMIKLFCEIMDECHF